MTYVGTINGAFGVRVDAESQEEAGELVRGLLPVREGDVLHVLPDDKYRRVCAETDPRPYSADPGTDRIRIDSRKRAVMAAGRVVPRTKETKDE